MTDVHSRGECRDPESRESLHKWVQASLKSLTCLPSCQPTLLSGRGNISPFSLCSQQTLWNFLSEAMVRSVAFLTCELGCHGTIGGETADLWVGLEDMSVRSLPTTSSAENQQLDLPRRVTMVSFHTKQRWHLNGHRLKVKAFIPFLLRTSFLQFWETTPRWARGQEALDRIVFKSNPVPPTSLRNQGAYLDPS